MQRVLSLACLLLLVGVSAVVEAMRGHAGTARRHHTSLAKSALRAATEKVKVALYMESFCPDCKLTITSYLYPNFAYKGLDQIVDLQLVPYGNAHQSQLSSGEWQFTCQHGDKECAGNIIESCVIKYYPEVATHFKFVNCIESEASPLNASESCAKSLGLDWETINTCVTGAEGNALEHEMGKLTEQLSPAHTYVPWITINGKHVDEDVDSNPIAAICAAYHGPNKPEACLTVPVVLYYESYCPGCRELITKELYPAWKHQGLDQIIDLTLVPYGNTKRVNTSTGFEYTCQHGPNECLADLYEGCAIVQNLPHYFDFIYCVENSEDPVNGTLACAAAAGYDYDHAIAACAKEHGAEVQDGFAELTEALVPKHTHVPWLTINGNHDSEYEDDPVANICAAYKGYLKPAACQATTPSPLHASKKQSHHHKKSKPSHHRRHH